MTSPMLGGLRLAAVALACAYGCASPDQTVPEALPGQIPPFVTVVEPYPPRNFGLAVESAKWDRVRDGVGFSEIRVNGYHAELADVVGILKSSNWHDGWVARTLMGATRQFVWRLGYFFQDLPVGGGPPHPYFASMAWTFRVEDRQVVEKHHAFPCTLPDRSAELASPRRCFDVVYDSSTVGVSHNSFHGIGSQVGPHGAAVPSDHFSPPRIRTTLLIDPRMGRAAERTTPVFRFIPYHPAWRAFLASLPAVRWTDEGVMPIAMLSNAFDWVIFWGDGDLSLHGADADGEGYTSSVWQTREPATEELGIVGHQRWLHCHPDDLVIGGPTFQPRRFSTEIRWYGAEGTPSEFWYEADGLREGFHFAFAPDGAPIHVGCYRGGLLHGLVYHYGYRGEPAQWTLVAVHLYELGERLGSWEAGPDEALFSRPCDPYVTPLPFPPDADRPVWRHRYPRAYLPDECAVRIDGRAHSAGGVTTGTVMGPMSSMMSGSVGTPPPMCEGPPEGDSGR